VRAAAVGISCSEGYDSARIILPKYQRCPHDGERVPTQFEIKGAEVEYPGTHVCSRGHLFLTDPDPKPGEETIDTADVRRVD
jgi:hypothetical protein